MKKFFRSVRIVLQQHQQGILIVVTACIILAAVTSVVVLFVAMAAPRIVYEPRTACDLFTTKEADGLLGDRALQSSSELPVVSSHTAVSKCGYTDSNPDTNQMRVAALIVRSGIDDDGVLENKRDFVQTQPRGATEVVQGVGDAAYFNTRGGQLNILDGRDWIILSYGVGADPASNTREDALKFASVVVPTSTRTLPSY